MKPRFKLVSSESKQEKEEKARVSFADSLASYVPAGEKKSKFKLPSSSSSSSSSSASDPAVSSKAKFKLPTSMGPTAASYSKLTQLQHIKAKPGMWVGDKIPREREVRVYEEEKVLFKSITFADAVERIFLEILSNAADNCVRSRESCKPGPIVVSVSQDSRRITVRNGGLPIPIEVKEGEGVYIPEMIFGQLNSGSNFGEANIGAGTHGLGAKLANIFSLEFTVHVGDHVRGLEYFQKWTQGMERHEKPAISKYSRKDSFVEISYLLDFAYFKGDPKAGYSQEVLSLFTRHAIDTAFTSGVPVHFGALKFDLNIKGYAQLYFGDLEQRNSLYHVEGKELPLEILLIDSPNEAEVVSFVNGMMTPDGGVHVEAVLKSVGYHILAVLQEGLDKRKKKDEKGLKLTMKNVKPHLSAIINYRAMNPVFSSQTKSKLTSPTPSIKIPEKKLKAVLKWSLMDSLLKTIEDKGLSKLAKTDGKKKRHLMLERLEDANWAGGAKSHQCTLMVFEGDSASGYATYMMSSFAEGRDSWGIYPLKGKPLNTMQADPIKISENKEICGIKQAVGLREGMDYSLDSNFKTLRYGHFMIAADSDDDGKHIVGLILLFFYTRFPSLLRRGYVSILRTPIMRAFKGKIRIPFLSVRQYNEWKAKSPSHASWKVHYYKGLGTSTEEDVAEDMLKLEERVVKFVFDLKAAEKFTMAFHKDNSSQRKEWFTRMKLDQYNEKEAIELLKRLNISRFIEQEFGAYVLANMSRSIPSMVDGLKESQRKAVFVSGAVVWSISSCKASGIPSAKYELKKVSQVSGMLTAEAAYTHGEVNANKTIVRMAQEFVGSNNAPVFFASGSFGTRIRGGADAADPRYLFTHPHQFMSFFCHPDDKESLVHVIEEGKAVEPKNYFPPLPFALINGVSGVATGWSCFIPNHNPLNLIAWVRAKISGAPLPPIVPWYRGFTGKIVVKNGKGKFKMASERKEEKDAEDAEEEGEEDSIDKPLEADPEAEEVDEVKAPGGVEEVEAKHGKGGPAEDTREKKSKASKAKNVMITYGKFEEAEDGKVIVSELPVGRWTANYEEWLKSLLQEKKISEYRALPTANKVYFEVEGFESPSLKSLKLVKKYGLSNMILIDINGNPKKYKDAAAVMEDFYSVRLPIYSARRANLISKKKEKISEDQRKIMYIRLVNSKDIIITKTTKNAVVDKMVEHKISHDRELNLALYEKTSGSAFSDEEVARLESLVKKMEEELKELEAKKAVDFWLEDLDNFEKTYEKYCKKMEAKDSASVKVPRK